MNTKRSALYVVPTLAVATLLAVACDGNKMAAEPEGPAAAAAAPRSAVSSTTAAQEVAAVINAVTQAAAARDAAGLKQHYDPSAQIVDFGGLTKGWADYEAKYLSQSFSQLSKTSTDAHRVGAVSVQVEGNVAWAAFPYAITADVNGTATEIFGYGTATLRHNGTSWKIVQVQTAARQRRSYDPPL